MIDDPEISDDDPDNEDILDDLTEEDLKDIIRAIIARLDGQEWDADAADDIANILRRRALTIRDA